MTCGDPHGTLVHMKVKASNQILVFSWTLLEISKTIENDNDIRDYGCCTQLEIKVYVYFWTTYNNKNCYAPKAHINHHNSAQFRATQITETEKIWENFFA